MPPHKASPHQSKQLTADTAEAARFLSLLDPGATYFTFQTFDDNKERKDKRFARIVHGTLDKCWNELVALNDRGAGVFVTVNETDGKGRTAENIERVRALFNDLDGAPLDPVMQSEQKPHVVVESSPKKYHAYRFTSGVKLDQFSNLQKALAKQFGGDKSVHDLPRVMRLPGFVHRKSEPFLVQIIHTSDHPPFTAADFAEFNIKSGTNLKQAKGGDLNSAALTNLAAWVLEIFPDARFEAGTGAYRVTSAMLGRDLEEDLSIHPDGIRDWGTGEGRTPIDIIMEYGKKDFTEAAAWLREHLGDDLPTGVSLEDFYAYMPMHNYIFVPTRETWPASSINARFGTVVVGVDSDGEEIKIKASTWLDQNRPVDQMTWAPGLPMLIADRVVDKGGWIEKQGAVCFNLYRPPIITLGDPAKAGPWLDLVKKVYPEGADHIIAYLAQRVQHPEVKINHALFLGGAPGIGKDTLLAPVKRAVGPWNFEEVSPQQVMGRFNAYLKSVILRVSEIRDLGDVNRFQFHERMKTATAEPPDVLRVDEKNLREYSVFNCCAVIYTTNRKDSIYLPADDRRTYAAWSNLTPADFTKEYWDTIWQWYIDGGYGHVAAYLATYDISAFNPKAPPPKTATFWEIVELNRAPEDDELADAIDSLGTKDENGNLIRPNATTIKKIADAIPLANYDFHKWLTDRKNRRAIPHRMEQCGYVSVQNGSRKDGRWVIGKTRYVVYTRAELSIHDRHIAAQELVKKEEEAMRPRGGGPGGKKT
jgi:RepB DNA-primase from phage plasmid/Family of unknown function (DUF5906)